MPNPPTGTHPKSTVILFWNFGGVKSSYLISSFGGSTGAPFLAGVPLALLGGAGALLRDGDR